MNQKLHDRNESRIMINSRTMHSVNESIVVMLARVFHVRAGGDQSFYFFQIAYAACLWFVSISLGQIILGAFIYPFPFSNKPKCMPISFRAAILARKSK